MVVTTKYHYRTTMGVHWTNFYFWPMAVNPLFGAQKWVQNGTNCRFNGIYRFFGSMVSKLVPKHQRTFEGVRIYDFKHLIINFTKGVRTSVLLEYRVLLLPSEN